MKALGSRMGAGTYGAALLVLLGACATRELPTPNGQRSALSPAAKSGAALQVTKSLEKEADDAAEAPPHSQHAHPQHGGHHHGH